MQMGLRKQYPKHVKSNKIYDYKFMKSNLLWKITIKSAYITVRGNFFCILSSIDFNNSIKRYVTSSMGKWYWNKNFVTFVASKIYFNSEIIFSFHVSWKKFKFSFDMSLRFQKEIVCIPIKYRNSLLCLKRREKINEKYLL